MQDDFFILGKNCWRVERSSYASVIVDCGNYYRDLYEAICKARHSVFIVGWDIDSRIVLLRGEEAEAKGKPYTLFDLLQWKARGNPNLKIYLNRWDYSFFQRSEREPFGWLKWRLNSPENIYYCMDNVIPLGGCQHQKIITVDDEIAFSGGMDIALQRWDFREHYPKNPHRVDPKGSQDGVRIRYHPFHDVQCILAGPAAHALAELVRERWRLAAGFEPIPLRVQENQDQLPEVWPESNQPDFKNITTGISLTVPSIYGYPAEYQVKQLYLDQIRQARQFIYIENQFLTDLDIAVALNNRLRKQPSLRILLVSCYKPKGIMERKSMWTGRVRFHDILEAGEVKDRVALCYPISKENNVERTVRIHSKVMIVDDVILRVASSNLNRRSMYLDTECDISMQAEDNESRRKISEIRNDLIREHTGMEVDQIEGLVRNGDCIDTFLDYITTSRQHLKRVNDESYRHESLSSLATFFADPVKPLLPTGLTMPAHHPDTKKNSIRTIILGLSVLAVCIVWAYAWKTTLLEKHISVEDITEFLEARHDLFWALPMAILLFVIGGLIFFPLTILIAATGIAFGSVKGFFIAFLGALLSAICTYFIGRMIGIPFLRLITGHTAEKLKRYTEKAGILGIATLRMLPIAPFTAVNLSLGVTGLSWAVYFMGTALGLLPGLFVLTFLGSTLTDLLKSPNAETLVPVLLGLLGWLLLVCMSHALARHWQKHKV